MTLAIAVPLGERRKEGVIPELALGGGLAVTEEMEFF